MKKLLITIFVLAFLGFNVLAQNEKEATSSCVNRKPVVAGQFYPKTEKELRSTLAELFSSAEEKQSKHPVMAIVAPHAGYIYSGKVAASSYKQIDPSREFENIFILAPSHRVQFDGASIYSAGNYETPLGIVQVNRKLAKQLIDSHEVFHYKKEAHNQEHSLEVQLPFLQYYLKTDFKIVPVVTGTHDINQIKKVADALKPYFNDKNLFIVSTDFSHYPNYKDAEAIDYTTAEAIISNSSNQFIQTIRHNSQKNIRNLVTSVCGWPGMLTLLYITEDMDSIDVQKIHYSNSGDVLEMRDRVVGYWAIAFIKNQIRKIDMSYQLDLKEKEILLNIARETLENFIRHGSIPDVDENELTETLKEPTGAFVTLHKHGELRGCIGRFSPEDPLYKVVQNMTIASSTQDIRFPQVTEEELDELEIEISVLTPMEKVSSVDDIKLGVHGVYIKKGSHSGTFLPQVAQATGWSKEEFLGHCARDKAGLSWDEWKNEDVELYTYRAIIFNEDTKTE